MATPIKPQDTQEACNPVSSNCVIWQGPDIACINLCTGDSVSDVIAKLATELCTIIDELKISAYDLSCFDPLCPTPTSFQAMIQLLIDKVCALYNLDPTTSTAGCPDCEVTVATCLITQDNLGNDITTLQLKDYVILIGNRICTILTDVASQGTAITDLETRVTFIEENCCVAGNIPTVATSCLNRTASNIPVTSFASALETAFCALQTATGTPTALQVAIGQQCSGLGSEVPLDPAQAATPMSNIPGWVNSPVTVADSMTNMWLTICDMRAGLVDLISQVNACCAVSCSSIVSTITGIFDGVKNLTLTTSVSFPPGYNFCTNSTVIIAGSNGFTDVLSSVTLLPGATVIDLTTPQGNSFFSLFYNITVVPCYTDGSINCTPQTIVLPQMEGGVPCPTLTLNPTGSAGELDAAFTSTVPSIWGVSYTVVLRNASNVVVGSWTVSAATPPGAQSNIFTGLATGASYTATLTLYQGTSLRTCGSQTSVPS